MEREKEIRARLRQSLEVSHIRTMIICYTIAMLAGTVIAWLRNREAEASLLIAATIFSVFWIVIMAIYGIWLIRIFRDAKDYVFCNTTLAQLHSGRWKNTMYFTVVLDIPGSGKIVGKTHAIFQTHGWPGPLVEDYVNRKIEIGYNVTTGQVVVIG